MDAKYPPPYSTLAGALLNNITLGDITTTVNNTIQVSSGQGHGVGIHRHGKIRSLLQVLQGQLHDYHVGNGSKSRPWATLRVFSNTSTISSSGQKVPCFTSSDLVQGSLELNLDSPQNVNSINLSLRGRIITTSYEDGSCTFLDQPIIFWTRSNGDPRSVSPSIEDNAAPPTSHAAKKFDGKLSGQYSWPFSLSFPKDLPAWGQGGRMPTPQSFFEREIQASVQYDLVLRMTHGILRSDSKLQVNVEYVPSVTPAPFSLLRSYAYGENLPSPSPEIDPEGWHALPTASVRGRLFSERMVKLRSTLFLANPSFARGTIVPCYLSVECPDEQALDILANPKSLALRLYRRVEYYDDGGKCSISSARAAGNASVNRVHAHITEVERAIWLASSTAGPQGTIRQFNGEFHLSKELQPSCEFPLFKVSYHVELLPFDSPVFKLSSSSLDDFSTKEIPTSESHALLSHPVTITTLKGEGPRPVPFTKAKHRKERKTISKDYSCSVVPVTHFQCL
ncbi:hypothetical protein CPB84DRAFT_1742084 [Gymnopilus junonius]|uniref:Arrestin-like N-terminal domain-containing protein n=1 Tax=Gymnopilus junonius TaxID=109634 RepID=A0A9P5TU51_GYMJU|nr:hypothetical protein CPB84DRAFT_1742084 [Gymnopilus junonius]